MDAVSFFRKLWETVVEEITAERKLSAELIESSSERVKRPFTNDHTPTEFMRINFNCYNTCVAYTQRYATCHSLIAEEAARRFLDDPPAELKNYLLSRPSIRTVSIGGGPGSDLMGFFYALRKKWNEWKTPESNLQVEGKIYDYYHGWTCVLEKLDEVRIREDFGDLNKYSTLDMKFSEIDFSKNVDVRSKNLEALQEADVVLLEKVLSILSFTKGKALLRNVLSCMKNPEAVLMVVDTGKIMLEQVLKEFPNYRMIFGPTERVTLETLELPGQKFATSSSYEICVVQQQKSSSQ